MSSTPMPPYGTPQGGQFPQSPGAPPSPWPQHSAPQGAGVAVQHGMNPPQAHPSLAQYTTGYGSGTYPIYGTPREVTSTGRATAAMYAVGIVTILNLLSIPMFLWENSLVRKYGMFMRSDGELPGEAVMWGLGMLGLAFFLIAGAVTSVVLFLMWVHRAYRVMEVNDVSGLKQTSGWAVGWWFIPFANLVRPYQVIREIFERSAAPQSQAAYHMEQESSWIVGAWWLTWLVSCLATNLSTILETGNESPEQFIRLNWLTIAATCIYVLAGVLAIIVIRDITDRQRRAFRHRPAPMPQSMQPY